MVHNQGIDAKFVVVPFGAIISIQDHSSYLSYTRSSVSVYRGFSIVGSSTDENFVKLDIF